MYEKLYLMLLRCTLEHKIISLSLIAGLVWIGCGVEMERLEGVASSVLKCPLRIKHRILVISLFTMILSSYIDPLRHTSMYDRGDEGPPPPDLKQQLIEINIPQLISSFRRQRRQ